MYEVGPKQAKEACVKILKAGKVPMLHGSPGIGKTFLAVQIAELFNLKFLDFRLSQADPTDLNGFPALSEDKRRMGFKPPEDFPLAGIDSVPKGYDGWLLMLDEINSAALSVQAAAYKLILDKRIGKYGLHENVAMMGAGNLMTDRAIVNRMGTAMQSRMVHLRMRVVEEDWQEWANDNNIDYRVRAFLRFRPELLHKFDPNHDDLTYPCPRTWHFASDIISPYPTLDSTDLAVLQGTIGEGASVEFNGYCKVCGELPSLEDMIANPETINIPKEPSYEYAFATLIGSAMSPSNCSRLMIVMEKLPLEFQVVCMKDVYARSTDDKPTKEQPEIKDWISRNAKKFFDS